jgi:hypothetical protein
MTSIEMAINIEAVRVPSIRMSDSYGILSVLGNSIRDEGMRRPITVWKDGTLISGLRRHRACLLLGRKQIQAVFVDTIEDAAKSLLADNEDDYLARPLKWTEVCHLWELLRRLDGPAAARRAEQARRRGVELRRLTQAGKRKPGRAGNHSEDYVLAVLGPPFGVSEATARRLWNVYVQANAVIQSGDGEKRDQARRALRSIDAGESTISAEYQRLVSGRIAPVSRPKPVAPIESAASARQVAAWERALPQMEGLTAGLVELGPPNAGLTWEHVGPVYTRLMAVRRELEKIIKQMRETNRA